MTLVSRYPTRLYELLGLQEPNIPIDLDPTSLQSIVDVMQGGRIYSRFLHGQVTQTSGQPAQFLQLLAQSEDLRVVHHLSVENQAPTFAPWYPQIRLTEAALPSQTVHVYGKGITTPGILPAENIGSQEFIPFGRFIIPPGWQLFMAFGQTAGLEAQHCRFLYEVMPFGFNPTF